MKTVFLHGFLGSPRAWHAVVDALLLDASYTLSPWLPGHGHVPWFSGASFLDAIDALAGELPNAPSVLVGYSLGARLALGLCARHPSRVARAVLIGVNPGLRDPAARAARLADDTALANTLEGARDLNAFVERWERQPLFASQEALADSVRQARRRERQGHTPEGIAWALRVLSLGAMPCWDDLSLIPSRVDLITGSRDEKFTQLARGLAATSSRSTHHEIEGAGHDVVLEAPHRVARILSDCLGMTHAVPDTSLLPHSEAS